MSPIDFKDPQNHGTYSARTVSPQWIERIGALVATGRRNLAVDLGCGGGIYAVALRKLGFARVIGVDGSQVSLAAARETASGDGGIGFLNSDVLACALSDEVVDLVLERAVIHHLGASDLTRNAEEVRRVLQPGGVFILQTRSIEDLAGGNVTDLGASMYRSPLLSGVERARRHDEATITAALRSAGFVSCPVFKVREPIKEYQRPEHLRADVVGRIGRSVLHHLDDDQLRLLADEMLASITGWPFVDTEVASVWVAAT